MPLLETSVKLQRDKRETRERDEAMADGLTQTNEIASKSSEWNTPT